MRAEPAGKPVMNPFEHIAAGIDAALDRKDAETVVALFERRHQMIAERLSGDCAEPMPRALLETLVAQDRAWLRQGCGIRDTIRNELDNYDSTRQSSLHIGQAYGATTSSAGRFVSSHG